jgi:hypothetical protein
MMFCATLSYNNITGDSLLATEYFYTKALAC